jgi:hypothetical protein
LVIGSVAGCRRDAAMQCRCILGDHIARRLKEDGDVSSDGIWSVAYAHPDTVTCSILTRRSRTTAGLNVCSNLFPAIGNLSLRTSGLGRKHQFVEVASGLQRVFDPSTPTERPVQRHKQSVALASDECPLPRPRKNTVTKTERPHPALSGCTPATGKCAAVAVIKLGRPQVTPPTSVECQLFEGLNSHCRPAAEVWQYLRCVRRSAEIAGIFVRL